jgi:hypothetical protein
MSLHIDEERLKDWMAYNEIRSAAAAIEILKKPQYQWLGIIKWEKEPARDWFTIPPELLEPWPEEWK